MDRLLRTIMGERLPCKTASRGIPCFSTIKTYIEKIEDIGFKIDIFLIYLLHYGHLCAHIFSLRGPLCVHPVWRQWWCRAQTPMMHLSSLFCSMWDQHASLSASLSVPSARRHRGKVLLSSLPCTSELTRSFIHSLEPIGLSFPRLVSHVPLATFVMFYHPFLARFMKTPSLVHSFFAPCPRRQHTPHYCFFFWCSHSSVLSQYTRVYFLSTLIHNPSTSAFILWSFPRVLWSYTVLFFSSFS